LRAMSAEQLSKPQKDSRFRLDCLPEQSVTVCAPAFSIE
jgi:hypothetical protein